MAFLVCSEFCVESGLQKVGLGGTHPLTRRYIFFGVISMFGWLINLFNWLTELWGKVPDSVKERIIDMIVDTFEEIFREFFRSKKREKEANNE
ncbi:hypothetical protein ACWOUW_004385 [Vibrio vulnificus]